MGGFGGILFLGLVDGAGGVAAEEKGEVAEQAELGAAIAVEAAASPETPEVLRTRCLRRRTLLRYRLHDFAQCLVLRIILIRGWHRLRQRQRRLLRLRRGSINRRRCRWWRVGRRGGEGGCGGGGGGGENAALREEVVGGARVGVGGEEVEVGGGVEEGVAVDGDAVGSGRLGEVVGEGDPWAPAPCRALWE